MNQLNQMLKQAQKMQAQIAQIQEKMGQMELVGEAGAGLVKVTLNGRGEMRRIQLDPSLIVSDEKELLEDLIVAGFNDAKTKIEQKTAEEMSKATGGMALPPGFQL